MPELSSDRTTPLPLAGLRIGLLTASASRLGGGVFEAVVQQAGMIRELGGEARIFALADAESARDAERFAPSRVEHLAVTGPGQIGFAPGLVRRLLAAELDLLHLHGIWMYPSRAGLVWARRTGRPYLVSPHGMLDPWITGRGRWKKWLARLGYERASWAAASHLHALTGDEARDIAAESGRDDSLIIPNPAPAVVTGSIGPRGPKVLYLGRIHPKKNLAALVDAWNRLVAGGRLLDGARLTIGGWGDAGDVEMLRAALRDAALSIEFVGPLFGEAKAAALADARFVVLPSESEGLPMAMLEAWAAGAPTIMTDACHLPEGFAAGAALRCATDADSIAAALARGLALADDDWQAMAKAARDLCNGPFSGRQIAARWAQVYRDLAGTGR